ncbi:MAG: DUF523 domain-containing protein [Candidatus Cloacimonadales bacterium]|nr:DUF523 domain-containing protein [Candidatus Cloacimonadales bacterium]
MILVSACLAGIKCKYDGKDNAHEKIIELVRQGLTIPVCPEQLGGLPTPRPPSEITGQNVITIDGINVTENFQKGAEETLRIAKLVNCKKAILKQRSPSCGFGFIYDGTHSGKVIEGNGITAELLHKNGIKILTEEDFQIE